MLDINGKKIEVGNKIKTTQPSGGWLPPSSPVIGICEIDKEGDFVIRFREKNRNFDQFIRLGGQINEII